MAKSLFNLSKASLPLAMFLAFTGFTGWTLGDAATRGLQDYSPFEIAFITSGITSIILLVLAPYLGGGIKASLKKPKQGLQLIRGLILSVSNVAAVFAFWYLELPMAYALIFLAPFLAKISAVILMKEKIKPISWAITCLGFIGVLIVLRPGFIPFNIGSFAALIVAFLFSFGYVMGRFIGEENQTLFAQAFYSRIFVVLFAGIGAIFTGFTPITLNAALTFLFIGTINVYGSIVVAWAFTSAPTAYIAPIHYTQIVLGSIWGILLFGEYPDMFTYIGGGVIIFAGLLLIYFGHKTDHQKT